MTEDFCLQIWASLEWVVWNIPALHNGSYAWCWPKVGRCDETCLLFPTCFWFLERPLCVLAQGLNEPICRQIIIIRRPVSGSREQRFRFYLMKMCLKGSWGDKLVVWQGLKSPCWRVPKEDPLWCSGICLAFTMACICQGAERFPCPSCLEKVLPEHLFVLSYLSTVCCWGWAQVPPKFTLLIFECRWKWHKSIEPVLRCCQFSTFSVCYFVTSVMILMFFNWAVLMHCRLLCFTDNFGASGV